MALNDPHAAKRANVEACLTCRFFFPSPKCNETGGREKHVTGDCRRFPPQGNYNGHQTVYVSGWCGEYKEDVLKVAHQKTFDAK